MYQHLPEFIRRESKAYWFITTPQACAGIGLALLLAFSGLTLLAPLGFILGALVATKRQGIFIFERGRGLAQWLWLQLQEDVLEQGEFHRSSPRPGRGVIVVRGPGHTIAIRPGKGAGQ
jgi:hypothetical protein